MPHEAPSSSKDIYNGEASESEWECGGYRFHKLPDYEQRISELPRLGALRMANPIRQIRGCTLLHSVRKQPAPRLSAQAAGFSMARH